MEKKLSKPKIRTAFIAIFAIAIVLSLTSIVMQLPIQSADARYFYDPISDTYKYCPAGYYYDWVDDWCYW